MSHGACDAGSSIDHAFDTNSACSDTYGSHDCFCNLEWESDNDGHLDTIFVDVDECDATSSLDNFCDVNSACYNTASSYICNCDHGWKSEQDGQSLFALMLMNVMQKLVLTTYVTSTRIVRLGWM